MFSSTSTNQTHRYLIFKDTLSIQNIDWFISNSWIWVYLAYREKPFKSNRISNLKTQRKSKTITLISTTEEKIGQAEVMISAIRSYITPKTKRFGGDRRRRSPPATGHRRSLRKFLVRTWRKLTYRDDFLGFSPYTFLL